MFQSNNFPFSNKSYKYSQQTNNLDKQSQFTKNYQIKNLIIIYQRGYNYNTRGYDNIL